MGCSDGTLIIVWNSQLTRLAHLVLAASKVVLEDPLEIPVYLKLPHEPFPSLKPLKRPPHIKATQAELVIHSPSHSPTIKPSFELRYISRLPHHANNSAHASDIKHTDAYHQTVQQTQRPTPS